MRRSLLCALALCSAVLTAPAGATTTGPDDAVVIAVIDSAPSPYHWDFAASRMPQALNADPADDLPLDRPPHEWLPGFTDPEAFSVYEPLPLTLAPDTPGAVVSELVTADQQTWGSIVRSDSEEINYYWVPGTKIIGLLEFGSYLFRQGISGANLNAEHGARTSSVAAGNINGTCPECVVVFLAYSDPAGGERAIEWAMSQPWIDLITNSYGFSKASRDRLYSGSDVQAQRAAIERGQTVFFSAGNGQDGGFLVPNTTYFSSQEGPDWIVTVGAVTPEGSDYSGSGKGADIAAPGGGYPSLGGATVATAGTFGGTSNATPVTAGLYARALWRARIALEGPSRIQDADVIATGAPVACEAARPSCELGDGALSSVELRARLFGGAVRTSGTSVGGRSLPVATPESAFLSQGHGVYFGRLRGSDAWAEEEARIFEPMLGARAELPRPEGEREWFTVDSYCRQIWWGSWSRGYYVDGVSSLPPADSGWPVRSALAEQCDQLFPPF